MRLPPAAARKPIRRRTPRERMPGHRTLGAVLWMSLTAAVTAPPHPAAAQQPVPRILEQDSSLNNLIDPPGYETAELGTLGTVARVGRGPRSMILIPGLGFGGDVFGTFMEGREDRYTMYAVTLPGFGGTPAPPTPPEGTSFGEQTWTRGATAAIERLMTAEGIENPILVGHWLTGTQIALRLALDHPDRVAAVVLLAGSARWVSGQPSPEAPDDRPLEERVAGVDGYLAPQWFKTVTRETWDDNNFLPSDYAVHPVLGLRLWRAAARPPLHVWVRYLCEFYAQDVTLELDRLAVPTLLLRPGLENHYHPPDNDYLRAYTHRSWGDAAAEHETLEAKTIPNSRIVMWIDQPELVDAAVNAFLERVLGSS